MEGAGLSQPPFTATVLSDGSRNYPWSGPHTSPMRRLSPCSRKPRPQRGCGEVPGLLTDWIDR